jgi:hypothetical protein
MLESLFIEVGLPRSKGVEDGPPGIVRRDAMRRGALAPLAPWRLWLRQMQANFSAPQIAPARCRGSRKSPTLERAEQLEKSRGFGEDGAKWTTEVSSTIKT